MPSDGQTLWRRAANLKRHASLSSQAENNFQISPALWRLTSRSDNWARYEVAQGETAQRKDDWPLQREPGRGDLKPGVDARKEAIRGNKRAL